MYNSHAYEPVETGKYSARLMFDVLGDVAKTMPPSENDKILTF